jgi:hypothetical protein
MGVDQNQVCPGWLRLRAQRRREGNDKNDAESHSGLNLHACILPNALDDFQMPAASSVCFVGSCMVRRSFAAMAVCITALVSCARISSAPEPAFDDWHLASPDEGDMLVLDSASLRPVVAHGEMVALDRIVRFTNFQRGRFHPDLVRAITEDGQVMEGFARTLVRSIPPGATLLIDLQQLSPDDIRSLTALTRTLVTMSSTLAQSRTAIIIPAGDTVSYPAGILARVVDLQLVRLWGEFRPGTRPGPPVTPEFIRRELGARSTAIGASHVAAYFPLYGYLWDRSSAARPITFEEASRMVIKEGGAFRRDPSSQFLTASGQNGWSVWVPDLTTTKVLIQAARSRGATVIALSHFRGADPEILREYPIRR